METLNITTKRLLIRNLQLTDVQAFHTYRSNAEVTKYQSFDVMDNEQCLAFITRQMHRQFGKLGEWVQYGLENINTKELIGDCAIKLNDDDARIAEVGITISHLHQKNGYAKEALLGILSFLFDEKNIRRIVEIVDVDNIASINMLKSVGFRQEGHFIENIFFKGKWGSEYQFAMLKSEWDLNK